jgi:hypothetical protein
MPQFCPEMLFGTEQVFPFRISGSGNPERTAHSAFPRSGNADRRSERVERICRAGEWILPIWGNYFILLLFLSVSTCFRHALSHSVTPRVDFGISQACTGCCCPCPYVYLLPCAKLCAKCYSFCSILL